MSNSLVRISYLLYLTNVCILVMPNAHIAGLNPHDWPLALRNGPTPGYPSYLQSLGSSMTPQSSSSIPTSLLSNHSPSNADIPLSSRSHHPSSLLLPGAGKIKPVRSPSSASVSPPMKSPSSGEFMKDLNSPPPQTTPSGVSFRPTDPLFDLGKHSGLWAAGAAAGFPNLVNHLNSK